MNGKSIKPCPHCGGAGYLNSNFSNKTRTYFVYVKCDLCGAQGKIYNSAQDPAAGWTGDACESAIDAWNMRTKGA